LHLFQSSLQKSNEIKTAAVSTNKNSVTAAAKCRIPAEELSTLNEGFAVGSAPPFPYTFDLLRKNTEDDCTISNHATKMMIRHLEEDDIVGILPELVREFGSLMPQTNSNNPGDKVASEVENYLFSITVLIGLTQRVKRRIKGYPEGRKSNYPDHNVICIVEQIPVISSNPTQPQSYNEQIVGIGEISWQPPNPNRNAPPFVLPYFIKQLLSKFNAGTDDDGQLVDTPRGYISNVLVWKSRRGLGYARVLMAALEGIAKSWECQDVRLHVDADEKSGKVAQSLYRNLGYAGVPDRGSTSRKAKGDRVVLEWLGPSMVNEGLYMVDGIPLLYMQKSFEI
jgi:ribosomal protein S18 acetylase RimI-like enzyme